MASLLSALTLDLSLITVYNNTTRIVNAPPLVAIVYTSFFVG